MKILALASVIALTACNSSTPATSTTSTQAAPTTSSNDITPVKNVKSIDSQLAEAGALYDKGDSTKDIQIWKSLADSGNAEAQCNLGMMYEGSDASNGVVKDSAQSVMWYLKAAKQGNALAQYALGLDYYSGDGVPKNRATALKWITLAANQGQPKALDLLKNIQAAQAAQETQRRTTPTTTPTGHFRADGLYIYDRTDAAPVSHTVQSTSPQCAMLANLLERYANAGMSRQMDTIRGNMDQQGCR
jgi:TPR repeat protein